MSKHITRVFLVVGSIMLLLACSNNKKQFIVEGTISNADTLTLFLEKREHSSVTVLDSVKLNKDGNFTFKQDALGYSEFYRLRLNNQSINFSVDSTETISIDSNSKTFGSEYTVKGSPYSAQIKEVVLSYNKFASNMKDLQNQVAAKTITSQQFFSQIDSLVNDYKGKTKLFILNNHMSTAAYYALFQQIEGYLIFDINNRKDLQLFQTIGTTWNTFRPQSPRSVQLNDFTLAALANLKAEKEREATLKMLQEQEPVEHKDYFVVTLPNVENKEVSTASLYGKPFLLDFTGYQAEYSVYHNVRLNKAYEKYKSKIGIYQVSLDEQKHIWQNAAINLPWITVRDAQGVKSPLLGKFNIQTLPTTFLIDKDGNVVKRLSVGDDFESEIAKIL